MLQHTERRVARSDNAYEALALQLAATARSASFSTLVLTDAQGIKVASTGDSLEAEEIAAMCPAMVRGNRIWQGRIETARGPGRLVTVAPFDCFGGRLFLCAVGGTKQAIEAALLIGSRGVNRILA